MVVSALAALSLNLGAVQQYFVSDDFIFLHQLRFTQPSFLDSLVYFGRDWGLGAQFYRPLTRVLWAGEYTLLGQTAAGWHLSSALLYSLTAALVYILAMQLSQRSTAALVAGLLFAAHPAHAETVSWISNQSDLLVAPLCVGATICYVKARSLTAGGSLRKSYSYYGLALAFFLVALLSKESAAGFVLIPFVYDICFGLRKGNWKAHRQWQATIARQLPFWGVAGVYVGLRLHALGGLGGYVSGSASSLVPLNIFVRSYANWLLMPIGLSLWSALLLALLALAGLALVVRADAQEENVKSGGDLTESGPRGLRFRSVRTAGFSLCWLVLFLLPTASTPPSLRFVYLSTVGLSILVATLCSLDRRGISGVDAPARTGRIARYAWALPTLVKLLLLVTLLVGSESSALASQSYWTRAGQIVRSIIRELRDGRPDLVNYSYVYAAGLPEANEQALIFRTGFPQAVQLAYDNPTIQGVSTPSFPVVEQHLSQAYFVQYQNGHLMARDDLVLALLRRNTSIKEGKEQPFLSWNFTAGTPAAGDWSVASGAGTLSRTERSLVFTAPGGASARSPSFGLPAPSLGSLSLSTGSIRLRGDKSAAQLIVHWLVETPGGPVERASAPLIVNAGRESHAYSIKPPDMSVFFYSDIVGELRLEMPADVSELDVEKVVLYKLP